MRLRPSRPVQDPEKNAMSTVHESYTARWIFNFLRSDSNSHVKPQAEEEIESDRDDPPYSKSESQHASAKLWAIYIAEADRYDTALVESWKADMEGMLIFSGLFSASLTAFLIESYRTLRPDSGDLTVEILGQIAQQLAAISNNATTAYTETEKFRPLPSSLVCNTLWFISLTLSITCALLATLVEQWAREFLHKTQKRPSPIRRARVLSFLYFGVRRFGMHAVVDLIPMLLHVSLILFLAGLVAFLLPINRLMMALISGLLGVFLMLYAALTLSPIITLDSPYRTPFSDLCWNMVQRVHSYLASGSRNTPTRTINDTVVAMALQANERRDQRAFSWTLEALTDDHEFLPFLEAIPEAIHGVKGFHYANDYLFIPLLNGFTPDQRSLGNRITEFLISSRNMGTNDPMRQRRLIAGMKAIWALGMISGRRGDLFHHSDRLWFDKAAHDVVDGPEDRVLGPQYSDSLGPFAEAAAVAMHFSHANNLRRYIATVARIMDRTMMDRNSLLAAINTILDRICDLHVVDYPILFTSYTDTLRTFSADQNMEGVSKLGSILRSMADDSIWLELHVTILCNFLARAAFVVRRGSSLPHEYLQTCKNIVPRVTYPVGSHQIEHATTFMPRPITFDSVPKYFDLAPETLSTEISDLDRIMACFFRILPFLRLEDVVPTFAIYLAKRNHTETIEFATDACYLPYLFDCLVARLHVIVEDYNILLAIAVVQTLPRFHHHLFAWHDRDERLYTHMKEHALLHIPYLHSISSLIILRRLNHYSHLLLPGRRITQSETVESRASELRAIDEDPLLIGGMHILDALQNVPTARVESELLHRIDQTMVFTVTTFIMACAGPMKPHLMFAAMSAMCQCLPMKYDSLDTNIQIEFAHAWVALVNDLTNQHALNVELKHLTRSLFRWIEGSIEALYSPAAASTLYEASSEYLVFLQNSEEAKAGGINEVKTVLGDLATRMTADGITLPKIAPRY